MGAMMVDVAEGKRVTNANTNHSTPFRLVALSHVNVTEAAAKEFYGTVLGLTVLPKPPGTRQNVGAWYELGGVQLHLSVEENATNAASDRHVCYVVADVAVAERHLRDSGVEIISDPRPIEGVNRFYVRDPGGNLIEITEAKEQV
jgi:catechol 2,3-dioxygenase-like lactoylglutathione lyase family enzyme